MAGSSPIMSPLHAGHPQAALAKEALEIICTEFQPRHSLTLSSVQPDGSLRYTLYEMWPSHVRLWPIMPDAHAMTGTGCVPKSTAVPAINVIMHC